MTVGLYSALAASASVFIGILTALLVNNLVKLKSEKDLVERRIESLDSRIQGLKQEKNALEEYATNIEEPRFPEKGRFSPEYQHIDSTSSMVAADMMADVQSTRQHNERHRRWNQIRAQLESFNSEQERFSDRYESLDSSGVESTLYASVITILLSVGLPLFAYLLRISGVILFSGFSWLEPVVVFVVWAVGLGYVLYHLNTQVASVKNDIE
ncbi:hypothetical protein OB955_00060 [Halobacteria archaeon AArc-m2/3/4]|uniref:Uncharacterized protein n=1 Tax=Natronoglomus mannanivorans TaxID=2979990 RepID=A0ABT2Q882_9EURY|nr:hypothetical protein [Halobacteria archaeon AArc-m2/3/4]